LTSKWATCGERIAVSPISADPDVNNCAEQMHDNHHLAGYDLSTNQKLCGL